MFFLLIKIIIKFLRFIWFKSKNLNLRNSQHSMLTKVIINLLQKNRKETKNLIYVLTNV